MARDGKRMTLDLPLKSVERLDRLKEVTEGESYADVIRNAIRLYEAMVGEMVDGREFGIRDPGGEWKVYQIFAPARDS